MQHTRDHAFALRLLGRLVAAEAVRKNVVGDALAEPARRVVIAVVYVSWYLCRPTRATPPDRRSRVHSSADHPPAPPKNNTSTDRDAAAYRLPYTGRASLDSRTSAADRIRPDSVFLNPKGNMQRRPVPAADKQKTRPPALPVPRHTASCMQRCGSETYYQKCDSRKLLQTYILLPNHTLPLYQQYWR